jgi:adsorption protein B
MMAFADLPARFALGLELVQNELLLFSAFWFVIGAFDEAVVDGVWLFLRLTGRTGEARLSRAEERAPLSAPLAVFIAAWREAEVIGHTVRHALGAWAQRNVRLYVGCYANDPATISAIAAASAGDPRLRIVIHDSIGPTTKADCLNRVYRAMAADEERERFRFKGVVIHDSEDMVHPAELVAIGRGLERADFVQLPVLPVPQPRSPWIAGHYTDEFAEAHGKTLVVRDALRAAIPAAGVGCGFSRARLGDLARERSGDGPFAAECLTEDYELGVLFSRGGRAARFLRLRDADGALVATRAYFPASLETAVRQKTRWVHGIALQGWERLGWTRRPLELWMTLRDRRGPLMALVLAVAYLWLCLSGLLLVAQAFGLSRPVPASPLLPTVLTLCLTSVLWRMVVRFAFTTREYGLAEGARSLLRIFVGNVIAIMAGRRALVAYARTLRGAAPVWDKTEHREHPAAAALVPA